MTIKVNKISLAVCMASLLSCSVENDSKSSSDVLIDRLIESELEKNPELQEKTFLWSTTPEGEHELKISAECQPYQVLDDLQAVTGVAYQNALSEKVRLCESQWRAGKPGGVMGLLEGQRLDYDIRENSRIQQIEIKTKSGVLLNGFLGIQPGQEKLPLIVVKCGLFCDGGYTNMVKVSFLQFFDHMPYHVLYLTNRTSKSFVQKNGILTVGGIAEGRDMIEAAQWAQESKELKGRISQMVSVGISLGGQAALYSSVYNSKLSEPVFSSAVAICPVVNLKSTFTTLFDNSIVGTIAYNMAWDEIQQARSSAPTADEILPEKAPSPAELANLLAKITILDQEVHRPEWDDGSLRFAPGDLDSFWTASDFDSHLASVSTPTLLVASVDDPIVKTEVNADMLWQIAERNPAIQYLRLQTGSHCALGPSYGWDLFAKLMQSHIIAHGESANWQVKVPLLSSVPKGLKVSSWNIIETAGLKVAPKETHATATLVSVDPYCERGDCRSYHRAKLPLAQFAPLGVRFPANSVAEAEALTRKLNATVIPKVEALPKQKGAKNFSGFDVLLPIAK